MFINYIILYGEGLAKFDMKPTQYVRNFHKLLKLKKKFLKLTHPEIHHKKIKETRLGENISHKYN